MADFNNLTLTKRGAEALLASQAGQTLILSKIGMGSGSTDDFTGLTNLVAPEAMLPISEKRIDNESGYVSIAAKLVNKDITKGFYWKETGLFFQDENGNDVLFAYTSVIGDQYDYVPAYSDKRYVKHVRIANVISNANNIEVEEKGGLLYIDTLTFEEYKEFVSMEFENIKRLPVNNNLLVNSDFTNPVNQRGYDGTITDKSMYTIDRWKLNAGQSFNIDSNGITFKSGTATTYFVQKIEAKALFEKTVSLSMKINGKIYSLNNVLVNKDERVADLSISNGSILMFIGYDSTDCYSIGVILYNGATPTIEWAKLEYGEVATPYVPRLYDEELRLCQIYYTKFAGSRAFNVWGINSASIRFAGFLPHIMRIPPTVVINAIGISINGATTTIDDFEFNASSISKSYVYIDAIKDNHGLTFNDCLSLVADFILDAEL